MIPHTPLPWKVCRYRNGVEIDPIGFRIDESPLSDETEANAQLIVTSVNSYQAMKGALEHCLKVFNSQSDRGYYPLELMPQESHYLGKQGFQFIVEALNLANGKDGKP